MNPQQALQILGTVANLAVKNGGIYDTVQDAASVNTALNVLNSLVQESEKLAAANTTGEKSSKK